MSDRVIVERESDGYSVGVPVDVFHDEDRFKGFKIVSHEDGTPYDGPKTHGRKAAEHKAEAKAEKA